MITLSPVLLKKITTSCLQKDLKVLGYLQEIICRPSLANGLFASQIHFKDHLRTHRKPAYQKKITIKINLLTVMQVFGNAMGFHKRDSRTIIA